MSFKHDENAKTSMLALLKKRKLQIGLTTMMFSVLTFNLAFAEDPTKETATKEIYHIYNEQQYIGAVQDEQKVEALIEQKEQAASEQFANYVVDAGSNITVVPEQVFTVAIDEQETLEQLEQSIEVQAEAMSVVIGDKTVAYVKDEASFNEMLTQLKLLYVSQEQLDALNSNTNTALLEKNDTRLRSVEIIEQVTTAPVKVAPTAIVEPKQLAKRLVEGGVVTKQYSVQQGDALKSIAKAYGLTVNELVKANKHLTTGSKPVVGETLAIEVVEPYVNVEVKYEVLKHKSIGFEKQVKESASLLKGKIEIEQQGKKGKREIVYLMVDVNGERKSIAPISDEVVEQPVNEIKVVGTKEIPHIGTGQFAWPAVGGYISSQMGPRWGRSHDGIDIARPSDRTIKASDNGKVITASSHPTYGNYVVVNHNNGYETLYAHLSSISVSAGQTVAQGQKLGIMGTTGRSTGIHLHFEVYKNGALVNPMSVLNR